MRAARTTTKTVQHWVTVELTPGEADEVRLAIWRIAPHQDARPEHPLISLRNALADALSSEPPGPDD